MPNLDNFCVVELIIAPHSGSSDFMEYLNEDSFWVLFMGKVQDGHYCRKHFVVCTRDELDLVIEAAQVDLSLPLIPHVGRLSLVGLEAGESDFADLVAGLVKADVLWGFDWRGFGTLEAADRFLRELPKKFDDWPLLALLGVYDPVEGKTKPFAPPALKK